MVPTAPTVPLGPSTTPPPSHQVPPPRKKKKKSPRQEAMDKLYFGGLQPGKGEKLMDKYGITPREVFAYEARPKKNQLEGALE